MIERYFSLDVGQNGKLKKLLPEEEGTWLSPERGWSEELSGARRCYIVKCFFLAHDATQGGE